MIQALTRAADRGIKVRIHLDNGRLAESKSSKPFRDLATTPDVEIRAKGKNSALMYLKSYQIDGHVLRFEARFASGKDTADGLSCGSR